MTRWPAQLRAMLRDQAGATLTEYALIASALGILMIVTMKLIQTETGTQLNAAGTGLTALGTSPP
jgi:Flp pilus assembly pilin Flp